MADYVKTNWQDAPSTQTPINAENLNHMEQGIYNAQQAADQAQAGVDSLNTRSYAPIPVELVADMTDETKNYLYLGSENGYDSGYLYYWNGTAWTKGNEYQTGQVVTDPTLEEEGKPADAAATGAALTGLNNALTTIVTMEQGGLQASNGAEMSATNRIRSTGYVYGGCKLTVDDGYKILAVCYFDPVTEIFVSSVSPGLKTYTLTHPELVARFSVCKSDQTSDLVPADVTAKSSVNNVLTDLAFINKEQEKTNNKLVKTLTLEQGGISSGNDQVSDTKIRTAGYVYGGGKVSLSKSGFLIAYAYYYRIQENCNRASP